MNSEKQLCETMENKEMQTDSSGKYTIRRWVFDSSEFSFLWLPSISLGQVQWCAAGGARLLVAKLETFGVGKIENWKQEIVAAKGSENIMEGKEPKRIPDSDCPYLSMTQNSKYTEQAEVIQLKRKY